VGELEVPAPHGITEEAAPLTIDESAVQPAVAALAARRVAVDLTTDRGHGDIGDHDSALGRAGLQVLTYVPAPTGLTGVYKNMPRGIIALVFRCKITGGQLKTNSEVSAFQWADESAVRELASEAYAVRLLDALRQETTPAIRQHDGTQLID
jgi:hypothetical protein